VSDCRSGAVGSTASLAGHATLELAHQLIADAHSCAPRLQSLRSGPRTASHSVKPSCNAASPAYVTLSPRPAIYIHYPRGPGSGTFDHTKAHSKPIQWSPCLGPSHRSLQPPLAAAPKVSAAFVLQSVRLFRGRLVRAALGTHVAPAERRATGTPHRAHLHHLRSGHSRPRTSTAGTPRRAADAPLPLPPAAGPGAPGSRSSAALSPIDVTSPATRPGPYFFRSP